MASLLFFVFFFFFICILPLGLCTADEHNATDQIVVEVHNQARAAVGVGPLKWSSSLARIASLTVRYQRNKKQCKFADLSRGSYGANQEWAGYPVSPAEAVGQWVEEKKYYDHASNTCAAGHDVCRTYTQVVWRKSVEVGCARAQCVNGDSLTICLYFPPGNIQGESPY